MYAPGKGLTLLAFTEKGFTLAQTLASALGGRAFCSRHLEGFKLADWTKNAFASGDDLIFVGAVGIAVRAIAPYLVSKDTDPAVVAVDERGRFAVPLVSGHLGGANDLARNVAAACGAQPVITTATDANGLWAVDEWARRQGLRVTDIHRIVNVSSKLLEGKTVTVNSPWPIGGALPQGLALSDAEDADVLVSLRQHTLPGLALAPHAAVLGVGCRRDTPREAIEAAFERFVRDTGIWPACICQAATIDLKANEQGLLAFCAAHDWPLTCYSAQQLRAVEGDFTPSKFVSSITGVDNVCERACVLDSQGVLVEKKYAGGGVTLALAVRPITLDWRWMQ